MGVIDFRKELEKFDAAATDDQFDAYLLESTPLIETFNATLKRIGKELHHTNLQIEDFLATSAEEQEKDRVLASQQNMLKRSEEEKRALVDALVGILDHLEDLYRYVLDHNSGNWTEQVRLLWEKINAQLLRRGITPLDGEQTPFDAALHTVVDTRSDRSLPHGLVLKTLRRGYVYQSELIRKAQVVVNRNDEGSGGHRNSCWD